MNDERRGWEDGTQKMDEREGKKDRGNTDAGLPLHLDCIIVNDHFILHRECLKHGGGGGGGMFVRRHGAL